jgi:ferredoxin-nitrite reductase
MNDTLPFDSISGEKLSLEQQYYLDGIFTGLRNRGVTFADILPNPVTAAKSAPDLDSLIAEERIKRELHPLDAYASLLDDATANKAPDKENLFRYKWHGLFYLTPHSEAYMARLRIPAGILKTFQARELARISTELTTGYIQVTTRSNIQLRQIEPRHAPALLSRIQSVGLHTRGAGADNVRNITTNPTAGLDPCELIDTLPFCQELAQLIINNREFYDLPRKFNIAFDGGGLISSLEDTNDIGARAVNIIKSSASNPDIKPGIYFRLAVGGATGHKAFANDLGVLVPPAQIIKVLAAMLRVYIANGDRTNRKRARLKHLLEKWTLDQYLEATEKLLGYKLIRAPLDANGKSDLEAAPLRTSVPHPHVGAFPQKQSGLSWLGVSVPVGEITPKQLLRLCDLADNYASGELRLTPWQNIIIPNVPDAYIETLKKAVVKAGLDWRQNNIRSGLVACTGNSYCKFAAANTKKHARELADYLEKKLSLDQPINIHLTGCPNSCAQHYIGDIGLLGATVKVAGETKEGYHVFIGGGFAENKSLGRQIFQGISIEQLKPTLEKMLKVYLEKRSPGETFRNYTTRHDIGQLQALFS